MKTQKTVMSKIAQINKEELSAHKVELGLVDDIFEKGKKLEQELSQELKKMEMALLDYRKSYNKYETSMKSILSKTSNLSSQKKDIENKLKELDVNPKSVNGFFQTGEIIVDIEQIIKNKKTFFTKPSI